MQFEQLIHALEYDSDAHTILANSGNIALDALMEALPSSSKKVSWHILNIISHIGDPRAAEPVEQLLTSPDKVIQIAAIQCLEKIGNQQSIPALIELLLSEQGDELQIWIVHALGLLQAHETVYLLIDILENSTSSVVRYTTIEALQSIGDPAAIAPIRRFKSDNNHHVREYCNTALNHYYSLGYC